jgi:hypothetical protein
VRLFWDSLADDLQRDGFVCRLDGKDETDRETAAKLWGIPGIEVLLDGPTAVILAGLLQLACSHPSLQDEFHKPTQAAAREFVDGVRDYLFRFAPHLALLLEAGWDVKSDGSSAEA